VSLPLKFEEPLSRAAHPHACSRRSRSALRTVDQIEREADRPLTQLVGVLLQCRHCSTFPWLQCLRQTWGGFTVRNAGATGQLTVRAGSPFYSKTVLATAAKFDVHFSITARQDKRVRSAIDAILDQARQLRFRTG
jgi:hypothetical protein